jgi:hypothetical protein
MINIGERRSEVYRIVSEVFDSSREGIDRIASAMFSLADFGVGNEGHIGMQLLDEMIEGVRGPGQEFLIPPAEGPLNVACQRIREYYQNLS